MDENHRRSNLEVISDILRLREASKTQIMYGCNMSHRQLQRYLQVLIDRGFLERVVRPNPGIKYHTTEKGNALLTGIDAVLKLLEQ